MEGAVSENSWIQFEHVVYGSMRMRIEKTGPLRFKPNANSMRIHCGQAFIEYGYKAIYTQLYTKS